MKTLMFGLLMLLVSWDIIARSGEVKATLAAMKNQIEQGRAITVNDRVVYTPGNESFVFPVMQRWMKNPNSAIRLNAVKITGRLAVFTRADQPPVQALDILFKACEDKDACIGSLALQYLKQVKWQYFTYNYKAAIGFFLSEKQPLLDDYLYLAGYMYATDQIGTIEGLISSGKLDRKQLWLAHLALARLGRQQSMEECIKIANATPLGNDYLRLIVPGLIYTRQKTCTDVLVTLLKTNDKASTSSKKNTPKNISYRYRIIESLSSVIEGFPVKATFEGNLITPESEDALKTSIKWFDGHGEYKFKDEKKAGFGLALN